MHPKVKSISLWHLAWQLVACEVATPYILYLFVCHCFVQWGRVSTVNLYITAGVQVRCCMLLPV